MTIAEIKQAVEILLKTPQVCVPYVHGKPGIGKSAIFAQLAALLGISFIDVRFSQLESCDTRGIPKANEETGSCRWYPPEMLPFEKFADLPVPGRINRGKKFSDGGILFLDEINRSKFDVIQSLFELVNDRRVGLHNLLDNWFVVCAGNLGENDHTEVTEITDAAFNNRFIHFFVDDTEMFDCWLLWAKGEGNIHPDIIGFLETKPSNIYVDPKEEDVAYATPRTWDKMSQLIIQNPKMIAESIVDTFGPGLIGAVAVSFRDYLKTKAKITPVDILERYEQFKSKIKILERPKKYSLSTELIAFIKTHPELNDERIKNIHNFLTNHVDKDHMIAAFKTLVNMNIKYSGSLKQYSGKECEFMDPYLDLYDEMNSTISNILRKAKDSK